MKSDESRNITIRAPKKLREAIHAYAERQGISLTKLTLEYYRALLEADCKQEAEQI